MKYRFLLLVVALIGINITVPRRVQADGCSSYLYYVGLAEAELVDADTYFDENDNDAAAAPVKNATHDLDVAAHYVPNGTCYPQSQMNKAFVVGFHAMLDNMRLPDSDPKRNKASLDKMHFIVNHASRVNGRPEYEVMLSYYASAKDIVSLDFLKITGTDP